MATTTASPSDSLEDRRARGEEAVRQTPLSSHAESPQAGRADPVELLVEQNATREPDLVPVRHGRMMLSPFTFYRGAAKVMAADLAGTPTAGLEVQLCGDAHLSNFGAFGSPERQLLFGLNDFDETLPGPFEYDLKRMAASFTIAARNNGFNNADANAVTVESVKAYREAMGEFAEMRTFDVWYANMSEHDLQDALRTLGSSATPKPGRESPARRRAPSRRAAREAIARSPRRSRRPTSCCRRRTPATACTPSPASPRWWTASTASSTSRRWWCHSGS